jgi:hypothetical protein
MIGEVKFVTEAMAVTFFKIDGGMLSLKGMLSLAAKGGQVAAKKEKIILIMEYRMDKLKNF